MRQLIIVLSLALLMASELAAELNSRERAILRGVDAEVAKAGASYKAGDYGQAGEHIQRAIKQIELAVKAGSPELFESLRPAIRRVARAHTMLEFEGVTLPPFRQPQPPLGENSQSPLGEKISGDKSDPSLPRPIPAGSSPAPDNAVSFTRQVAPILVGRCGRCHVSDAKGGFNLSTFAALMKGPPEGVVVFPGDTVGSRLIETIETGDMPRGGGKVSAEELELLKKWINEGAKFDGADPAAAIASGTSPTANKDSRSGRPQVRRSTGSETVSFAADVAPLLVANCTGCHIDAAQTRGGLRMNTFAQMLRGGDSGPIIDAGKGDTSLLVQKLRGAVGERMPTGDRPALSPESIQLISTWIDEGATLDGASENQSLRVMSELAWAAAATPQQLSKRRADLALKNLKLVVADDNVETRSTEHFLVTGPVSAGTLEMVARQAEAQVKLAKTVARGESAEAYFRGRATLFVMPRRYDYSELAKMVEQRTIPSQWSSHWRFDGIDAYVAVVAGESEDEDQIADRLASPIIALAVATRGLDVPRWLAEGVGTAVASRRSATRDREAKLRLETELSEAFAAMDSAKQFLDGKMTAEQTDRIGAAIATTMLDRNFRRGFDGLVRSLEAGTPFDQAFLQSFNLPLQTFVSNWLKYVRGG